jgi:parvulin-like peptidyl-prolyl isomerase
MRKLAAVVLLVLLAGAAWAQILDVPVAVVRLTETANIGRRVLNEQLDLFSAQLGRELTSAEKREILDALIDDELLQQGAARANVRVTQEEITASLAGQQQQWSVLLGTALTDAQFREQVERQTGATWDEYLQDITNDLIKLKYVRQLRASDLTSVAPPTEAEIQAFYEEQATSFTNPAMVSFRHIYIDLRGKSDSARQDARARMQSLRREIRNGDATFDQISRRSLDDPEFSAADFGYLLRNDARSQALLGRPFIDQVFGLGVGDVSDVLESNVALHIVLITDKRGARILELGDPVLPGESVTVRQQIVNYLLAQREQVALGAAVDAVVADLREEAEITVFEQNLPW